MKSPYSNSPYFDNDPIINLNRDYWEADKLKKEDDKMKRINDYSFFTYQREGEKGVLNSIRYLDENQKYVFFKLLDDYFIIFYKSFQDYLADSCIFPLLCLAMPVHKK